MKRVYQIFTWFICSSTLMILDKHLYRLMKEGLRIFMTNVACITTYVQMQVVAL